MKGILTRLFNSLDTKNEGFSGRKLTALTLIFLAIYVHTSVDFHAKGVGLEFLITDVIGAFMCLGIITAQNIINFKKGDKDENK